MENETLHRISHSPAKKPMLQSGFVLGVIDLALLALGFVLAEYITEGRLMFTEGVSIGRTACLMMGCFMGMLCFWGFGMYSVVLLKPQPTIITCVLSFIYSFIVSALFPALVFSRWLRKLRFLLIGLFFGFLMLTLWRIGLYYFHRDRSHRRKMLIIEKTKDDNSRIRRMKYACMGSFDAWYEQVDVEDIESVKAFIKERFPHYDVVCLMETVPYEVRNLFVDAGEEMGKEFYVVPSMYEINFSKVSLDVLDDVMVFHLSSSRLSLGRMIIKRLMDIVLSALALAVAFIPMCVIALAVKLNSPGPVFYKQVRLTKDKREFSIYKFRSMVQDAEAKSGPTLAIKDDPRITGVGRFLRKTRLDELPQLINILKGDMSIVGPRPERPFFVEQYEKEIPNYNRRFEMRAGLTGLSHVYGRYSTDIADRTRYDLLYIQKYSLLLDIRIMLLTSRTLFLSDAAEGVWTVDPREAALQSRR